MKKKRWNIVFENDDFIVVDKPADYLTIPDRYNSEKENLYHCLQSYRENIYINHRLDKDTSGLVLFTKSEEAHKRFSVLFEQRKIDKFYFAIVSGTPPLEMAQIDLALAANKDRSQPVVVSEKGKKATTKYRIIKSWYHYSLLELKLITGRMHQIRVHLKSIHCPILCDPYYGNGLPLYLSDFKKKFRSSNKHAEKPLLERLALHAHKLSFINPMDNKAYEYESELPKDMRAAVKQFDKNLEEDQSFIEDTSSSQI